MSDQILYTIIGVAGGFFVLILVAFFVLQKKMNKGDMKRIKELREGTQEKNFSADVMYQKLYLVFKKIPLVKRYLLKIRRKLEIIYMQDEYQTRRQASKTLVQSLILIIPITLIVILLTKNDTLLLVILLLFEIFLIETIITGKIDKLDTKLLKQQIGFFAEIRHAYNEYNMVEEAIYEVSQNDELEVSRQGEKIYEILISDDPETELEKYYDVAPNSYLKEFAGVSYLTKEFGDRQIDGASLYLKNLNNITKEMQLEILKRDKLDYVFQSLSFIAIAPVLLLTPLKSWAINSFAFTSQFYNGKGGLIVEILLLILTIVCYILVRKVKDNGSIKDEYKDPNKVWQMKLYKNNFIKPIVDKFIPNKNTREYRKNINLMKEAAAKQKMETLYVNRICLSIIAFILSIFFFVLVHNTAVDYIYTEPVSDYDMLATIAEQDEESVRKREIYNRFLDKYKGQDITQEKLREHIANSSYFEEASEPDIDEAAEKIYKELQIINNERFKWFELLVACVVAWMGYQAPIWMLIFQKILRKLEMENEVMQFQTIITMLMKIERVNVEIILEWLERYSNIFREPITKCVNNYEAGAWEALEDLKNEIAFPQLIRLIESMQAAVEKIPIEKAFEELENERDYYQAKREEANNKLISRKGLIGKGIGFAPMICVFCGYLIAPLVVIGLTSMTQTFATMSTMY
ncbi:MAG: hypothetical protein J6A29_00435 [Clostridia bacterium]|nr:hypothetical protein [Clostridia bacterium]